MTNLKAVAKKMFLATFEGWTITHTWEYKKNHFLIVANGISMKGQSFKMVLTSKGWELDSI